MFLRASSRQLWRKASRTLALGVAIGLAVPASAHAQIVRGLVVDSVVGMTLVSSTVVLLDASGAEIARTLTDDQGLFLLRAPGAGRYRLRAEKEGYRSSEFPAFDLAADGIGPIRHPPPRIGPPDIHLSHRSGQDPVIPAQTLLATARVRFVREAIAMVVAETAAQAQAAAEKVAVDYAPLDAVARGLDAPNDLCFGPAPVHAEEGREGIAAFLDKRRPQWLKP